MREIHKKMSIEKNKGTQKAKVRETNQEMEKLLISKPQYTHRYRHGSANKDKLSRIERNQYLIRLLNHC